MLALHKFKITEEHKKFALESPEPMTLFALSCGMFSSPAVRLFFLSPFFPYFFLLFSLFYIFFIYFPLHLSRSGYIVNQ